MKKKKKLWKTVAGLVFGGVLLTFVVLMYMELKRLTNQIAYMQDTTNIILSDVNGMQSNIEQTLRKEASIVESYSIDIEDMDFVRRTYQVKVAAVPKEYTSKTKLSIFFGTTECSLKADGYAYTGTISLPLDKSFDGNITFLLANGKKKTTEVIEDYDGLNTHLESVLSGSIEDTPGYKGGTLSLDSACHFMLEGFDKYEFDELQLVAQLDDEEIYSQDLFENMPESSNGLTTTETAETTGNALPVGAYSGDKNCEFSYDLTEQATDHEIRLFLRAVSTEGYRFEYEVFKGNYLGSEEELDKESFSNTGYRAVYDRKGGRMEFK